MSGNKDEIIRKQVDILGVPSQEMIKKEIEWHERNESYKRLMIKMLVILVIAIAVIILITSLWVTVLQIESENMKPVLQAGEIVFAISIGEPKINDIVAFNHNEKIYIKRVTAVTDGGAVEVEELGTVDSDKMIGKVKFSIWPITKMGSVS